MREGKRRSVRKRWRSAARSGKMMSGSCGREAREALQRAVDARRSIGAAGY